MADVRDARNTDASLIEALSARVPGALAEIHRRHSTAVRAQARRITHDDQLADDVCQTVFTDLWRSPGRYRARRGSLRAWLVTAAHHRAVDAVRAEQARRQRDRRAMRVTAFAPLDGEARLIDVIGVHRAVEALPRDERRAIETAYFDDQSYRQTALLLGQPEGTVKSRIRSGLKHLRQTLDEHEPR